MILRFEIMRLTYTEVEAFCCVQELPRQVLATRLTVAGVECFLVVWRFTKFLVITRLCSASPMSGRLPNDWVNVCIRCDWKLSCATSSEQSPRRISHRPEVRPISSRYSTKWPAGERG